MIVSINDEQKIFLIALLQDQAEGYLKNPDDSKAGDRRMTNDLLFIFDRPSDKQTKVRYAV